MKMSITEITNDDFDDESEDDNQLQDRRYFCTLVLLVIKESFDSNYTRCTVKLRSLKLRFSLVVHLSCAIFSKLPLLVLYT